ncbi:Gypsy retrotransposon integrase-like protein 1 [Paramarasmius palmivorus]|uniref:Gypsy retrotransposon integrase-like protein 1 n=1 Tax=Paramarasmius palmivorus TaxID=297713 RepID=A0AAW0CWB8_9AGAR
MSSDEGAGPSVTSGKKKRLQGACDMCSDSANMPGGKCSPCISFNLQCTHNDPVKKRGPKSVYVAYLEGRIKTLEEQISQINRSRESESPQRIKDQPSPASTSSPPASKLTRSSPDFPHIPSRSSPGQSQPAGSSDEEDLAYLALLQHTKKLSLNVMEDRFFGPSSGFMYLKTAYNVKKESTGGDLNDAGNFKRSKFWATQSWEQPLTFPDYHFPDRDLMASLIALYFAHVNCFLPIIHKPTFETNVRQGLHLRDQRFGATLLLVCALGSKFSDDPRVFSAPGQHLSSGWKWYEQAQTFRRTSFDSSSLYEVQYYCLVTLYVYGASSTTAGWTSVGLGIRYAVELGVHRRKPEGHDLTAEDEQKRRAFWVLIALDRSIAGFLGRPPSLREEDFDTELPIDCDDEYWENPDPDLAFKQPAHIPSRSSAFISLVKLYDISAFAMRNIYSIKKSKVISGLFGDQWEQKIIAEITSAMNEWLHSLPDHLQWNPDRKPTKDAFYSQTVYLHTIYYDTQIQIHKAFCEKHSQLSFPAILMCSKAARMCVDILETHLEYGPLGMPETICAAYNAGVALLTDIWRSKHSGLKIDNDKMMGDAERALGILQALEERWSLAGRFRDFLGDLARGLEFSGAESSGKRQSSLGFEGKDVRESWNLDHSQSAGLYPTQTEVSSPAQYGAQTNYYPQQPQQPSNPRYHHNPSIPSIAHTNRKISPMVPPPNQAQYSYDYPTSTVQMGQREQYGGQLESAGYSRSSSTDSSQSQMVMNHPMPYNQGYADQPVYQDVGMATANAGSIPQDQNRHAQQARYMQDGSGMTPVNQGQNYGHATHHHPNISGWQGGQHPTHYGGYNFDDMGHYIESMAYLNGFMDRNSEMNYANVNAS